MNWQLIQLRHLFKVYSGSTPESGNAFYWDGTIPWVTPEDVSSLGENYWLSDTKRKITDDGFENTGLTIAPKNSIILTKRAPIGLLAILGIEACCNQGCFLLVPKVELNAEFYYHYLLAKKAHLQILGRGSTFMELSMDDIKSYKLPVVSFQEQNRIVSYLKKEIKAIDEVKHVAEDTILLLKEKKAAIINATVTGQLDIS